jgi:tetratricopeptide (TPR) repeat protein
VGQLAFASLVAAQPTPAAATPMPGVPAAATPPVIVPSRPVAKPVAPASRTSSMQQLSAGNKALGMKQTDAAIAAYQKAVAAWDGNHGAWYALGVANVQKRDWAAARAAWERAAALLPDNALYQQWLGLATFEASSEQGRDAAARALRIAAKLDAKLWRPHYVLGRIHRDADRPREAAESLMRAIAVAPKEVGPYIALAELYRRWDQHDQAIAVATAGLAQSSDSELWYALGTAYDDKRQDDKAIEAFSRALDFRADNAKAKFARGRALHRKGDRVRAKQDLDEFIKMAPPELEVQKQIATELVK